MGSQKKKEMKQETSENQEPSVGSPSDKSTAEQLAAIEEQRKALLEQVKREKAEAIQSRKSAKLHRNDELLKEKATVERVQEAIYTYNRLGKQAKSEHKILDRIADIIAGA
jgi:hypothetical protein